MNEFESSTLKALYLKLKKALLHIGQKKNNIW